MTPLPHICVVDDDAMVRTSLQMLLEVLDMRVSTYADAAAFLADRQALDCDVLLLDVRMPGMSGLQLQHLLTERGAQLPILFISGHGDIPMAVRAIRAGALDFLEKPFNEQDLLDWIHVALQRREAERRRLRDTDDLQQRLATLTRRERELLDAVMAGKANKCIASELGISVKTVEQHRGRMMNKLGARKVADIFRQLRPADPDSAMPG